MSQSAIGTLVKRKSRYVRLVHLPLGRSAEQLLQALHAVLNSIPAAVRSLGLVEAEPEDVGGDGVWHRR